MNNLARWPRSVLIAGHLCIDIFVPPTFVSEVLLSSTNGAIVSSVGLDLQPGGAVANVGLCLAGLGHSTVLLGLTGDDFLGIALQKMLERREMVTSAVQAVPAHQTSTTISLIDASSKKYFTLHNTAVNDVFSFSHFESLDLTDVGWLHFGYPALMSSILQNGMIELRHILTAAKSRNIITSLDLSRVPNGSNIVNFRSNLNPILPLVDILAPSVEDLLDVPGFFSEDIRAARSPSNSEIRSVAADFISKGVLIACIKLGGRGMFIMTSSDEQRMCAIGKCLGKNIKSWLNRQRWVPSRAMAVMNTVGAGDALIAGLISSLLHGMAFDQAVNYAQDVAASSLVENACHVGVSSVPMGSFAFYENSR